MPCPLGAIGHTRSKRPKPERYQALCKCRMIAAEVHSWAWVKELDVRQRSLAASLVVPHVVQRASTIGMAGAGIPLQQ